MTIAKRSYGVDVSAYQSTSVAYGSSKFAVVKLSEGVGYINPRAKQQIASAKAHGMLAMGYFFATHGASVSAAKAQARYAVSKAAAFGLPKGSYIADDWETGDGNNVYGGVAASTDAVLAAMTTIKEAGYRPLIYSGAYLLRNNLNVARLTKSYGNCIWVSSYKVMGRIDVPDFGWFPSMNGVAIWQFTDNWRGYNVDGNISLVDLHSPGGHATKKAKAAKQKRSLSLDPTVKWNVGAVAVVTNIDGACIYTSPKLDHRESKALKPYGSCWQVFGFQDGAVKVGKNQYFDGRAVYVKTNPIAYNSNKHALVKIVHNQCHALAAPKADAKKVYGIKAGTVLEVHGRVGRFLKIKKLHHGKQVYVTGNNAYIVL